MADHAGSGSAKRRRERRLRSWWRHERMSIAAALAEALHHSSGAPKYDKRVVEEAQHGAVRGQTTATRAGGPATQYFTFGDEGERLFWPQDRDLRRIPGHVEEPSLDVPALQMVEEVDDVPLALSALQEQAIVLATPEVPMASSVVRAVQPMGVELSLKLPGLDNVWFEDWTFHEYLEQVIPPDNPREFLIPADQRAQRSLPVLLRALLDALASGRLGEQVVDVPVRDRGPRASGSGSMERGTRPKQQHHNKNNTTTTATTKQPTTHNQQRHNQNSINTNSNNKNTNSNNKNSNSNNDISSNNNSSSNNNFTQQQQHTSTATHINSNTHQQQHTSTATHINSNTQKQQHNHNNHNNYNNNNHNHNNHNNLKASIPKRCPFFVRSLFDGPQRAAHGWWSRLAAEAAPSALVVATRAADGRCGPGHVYPPLSPTGTEDGQGQWGARVEVHGRAPEDAPFQAAGAQYFAMDDDEGEGEAPTAGRPAPLMEVLSQAGLGRHGGIGFELVLSFAVLQGVMEAEHVLPRFLEERRRRRKRKRRRRPRPGSRK